VTIGFLLFDVANITGGVNAVIEHAWGLQRLGHRVRLVIVGELPAQPPSWHPKLADLSLFSIDQATTEKFDVLFATWWVTYFELWRFESRVYGYFNQSLESRFHSEPRLKFLNRLTYSLPLLFVTEAKWLEEFIRLMQPQAEVARIPNGLSQQFFPRVGEPSKRNSPLKVLVEGPWGFPFKGLEAAFALLGECRRDVALEVGWLTSHSGGIRPSVGGEPVEIFEKVPISEVHRVLREYDVLLKLSRVEGVFGPPLEMFSQGGTAICSAVTGSDEYLVHGYNSLLVDRINENRVVRYLKVLSENPQCLDRLRRGAVETAQRTADWSTSAELLDRCLAKVESKGFDNSQLRPALKALATAKLDCSSGDASINSRGWLGRLFKHLRASA
jgi:glycosyltransferase involved in cell wall biosynthesis